MNQRMMLTGCLLGLSLSATSAQTSHMKMGDGTVRGQQLGEYQASWVQCARQDGRWNDAGPLTETLVIIGDVIRHTQQSVQPNGTVSQSVTYLDRHSLAPLRMEQKATSADGAPLAEVVRTLTDEGYSGQARQGDRSKQLNGKITSGMWHGGVLGLPLVTVDPDRYPVEFASSMMAFDATYRTVATIAGREMLEHETGAIEALLVDVEWHHNESGDVYPPGPDGSGGRYWLVPDPPAGYPYVPQYRTDTYLVSSLTEACPANDD